MKAHRAAAALPYQFALVGYSALAMPSSFGPLRFDLAMPRSPSEPSFLRKVSFLSRGLMFLIFFLVPIFAFASLDEGYLLATLEGIPETLIEGKVSAITGDLFFSETDSIIQGIEPITIKRIYVSRLKWEKYGGWLFFPHTVAILNKEYPFILTLSESTGTKRYFRLSPLPSVSNLRALKRKVPLHFALEETSYEEGLTNAVIGKPTAASNPHNINIDISLNHKYLTVKTAEGIVRTYKRKGALSEPLVFTYLLQTEKLPNQNCIIYNYDTNGLLKEIKTTNPFQTEIFASAQFERTENKIKITAYDGTNNTYSFKSFPHYEPLFLLSNDEAYQYALDEPLLTDINNRMHIEYYKRGLNQVQNEQISITSPYDLRLGRVKTLQTDHKTYEFIYHPEPTGQGGTTEVYDQNGAKTLFIYTKDLRPKEIHYFSKKEEDYQLTHAFHYLWDGPKLLSKETCVAEGEVKSKISYEYDEQGNPLETHLMQKRGNE